MELLNNLSCCFETSKDIGETSVELVICDCAISKKCCLRWETITYVSALIFSLADFFADLFGYITFESSLTDPGPIQGFIDAWLAFLVVSGVIVVSEVALPVYSLVRLSGCCAKEDNSEEELDSYR